MQKIDVCLSPELVSLYDFKDKTVVIIDILRATSCMVAGMGSGIRSITPVATVEECLELGSKGYVTAGERGGEKIKEFDIGNSPFSYMEERFTGKDIAITTTNGTRAISLSADADEIVIGAFLNLTSIVEYLKENQNDVILFCAGWKGQVNLEDTTYAGAVIDGLGDSYTYENDSVRVALSVFRDAKNDLYEYLKNASHAHRLRKFDIEKDIRFCATIDEFDVLPILREGKIELH